MREFFAGRKEAISAYLHEFLNRKVSELSSRHPLGPQAVIRLLDYSKQGKMIRGGLVGLAQGLFAGELDRDADRLGAVMELFQSALLVHDDIMDRDPLRRGKPAMHIQYAHDMQREEAAEADRTGESLAICVGDIAFFLGYEILSRLETEAETLRRLYSLCSKEMTGVGLGQMRDIRAGVLPEAPDQEEIFAIYVHKTGRYTFSLPLMAGALLGGADDESLEILSRLGEILGIIFQIKDDELGLFGSADKIGKPVGTDLSEGKQTIFYSRLLQELDEEGRRRVEALKGADLIPEEEIEFVRSSLERLGILSEIAETTTKLQGRANGLIGRLSLPKGEFSRVFREFMAYNLDRTI